MLCTFIIEGSSFGMNFSCVAKIFYKWPPVLSVEPDDFVERKASFFFIFIANCIAETFHSPSP